jgi:hypothetical protein
MKPRSTVKQEIGLSGPAAPPRSSNGGRKYALPCQLASCSIQLSGLQQLKPPSHAERVVVHLLDQDGIDRGVLGEAPIQSVARGF